MANLVAGKLPLEKNWKFPEILTDGKIENYDGAKNFAHSVWPCELTYDLSDEESSSKRIQFIRFLLWDGLGMPLSGPQKRDLRKYRYSVFVSTDGISFELVYQATEQGFNGWQVVEFIQPISVHSVRVTFHSNTANKSIHLVEFEVFNDIELPKIDFHNSEVTNHVFVDINNLRSSLREELISLVNGRFSEEMSSSQRKIQQLIDTVDQKNLLIDNIRKDGEKVLGDLKEAVKKLELVKIGLQFYDESEKNKKHAQYWLIASGGAILLFLGLIYLLFKGKYFDVDDFPSEDSIKSVFLLSKNILLRLLLISLSFYTLLFCVKNYKSKRHNYVVNKHKAIALSTAIELFSKVEKAKDEIIIQATQAIFSHQSSGYDDKESNDSSPNILNNVLGKIPMNDSN